MYFLQISLKRVFAIFDIIIKFISWLKRCMERYAERQERERKVKKERKKERKKETEKIS